MMKLDHPNALRFFGMIDDSNSLVCEFLSKVVYDMDGKQTEINNVRQLLDEKEESIPRPVRLQIASDAANGLTYLHTTGCVHCDFKSANVFIGGEGDDWVVEIGDFGESVFLAKEYVTTQIGTIQDNSRQMGGTIPFVAPEILEGIKPNKMSDIYSFGMFLIELLCPTRSNPLADDCLPMLALSTQRSLLMNVPHCLPSVPDSLQNYCKSSMVSSKGVGYQILRIGQRPLKSFKNWNI